jgi:hypothetical protein
LCNLCSLFKAKPTKAKPTFQQILEFDSSDTTLGNVMEKALSSRRTSTKSNFSDHVYNVERKDRPGESMDKEAMLSQYEDQEFYIVRQHSRRIVSRRPDETDEKDAAEEEEDSRLRHQGRNSLI